MAFCYAVLITRGKKTFAQIPDVMKEAVRKELIDLDAEFLAEE